MAFSVDLEHMWLLVATFCAVYLILLFVQWRMLNAEEHRMRRVHRDGDLSSPIHLESHRVRRQSRYVDMDTVSSPLQERRRSHLHRK